MRYHCLRWWREENEGERERGERKGERERREKGREREERERERERVLRFNRPYLTAEKSARETFGNLYYFQELGSSKRAESFLMLNPKCGLTLCILIPAGILIPNGVSLRSWSSVAKMAEGIGSSLRML